MHMETGKVLERQVDDPPAGGLWFEISEATYRGAIQPLTPITVPPLYTAVFETMKIELATQTEQIFMYRLPFTMINKVAMLAAAVATQCQKEIEEGKINSESEDP